MLAVQAITSAAIQSLQKSCPKYQTPVRSLTMAKGITKDATSKSDTANEKKNKFESFRRVASVTIAMQTNKLPAMATAIKSDIRVQRKISSIVLKFELSESLLIQIWHLCYEYGVCFNNTCISIGRLNKINQTCFNITKTDILLS